MKFSAIFTLGLASSALATPAIFKRDATDVIAGIDSKVDALASAVSSFNGGDPSAVQSASDDLVSTINAGVTAVNNGPDLEDTDALALTSPVQALTKKVEGVIDDLISKKETFVGAGAGGAVKASLDEQYTAADNLAKALSSKVSENLSSIAATLSAGITDAIQKGIDAYADVTDTPSTTTTTTAAETTTTGGSEETTTSEATSTTTSAPVIPTTTGATTTAAPSTTPASSSPAQPTYTGAASKAGFNLVGGALAAAAVVVAF